MHSIWKFPLEVTDEQVVQMPARSRILSVQVQNGVVCLWAVCVSDGSVSSERRVIRMYGTGNPIDDRTDTMNFIGTVQRGPFVFHVFEDN